MKNSRQLQDRIETYTELINGQCKCGEPVIKVTGSSCPLWNNGDRFHYPEDNTAGSIFRCKTCGEPINENFQIIIKK